MTTTGFAPTHKVPDGGLDAWAAPDGSVAAVARLESGLEVQVLQRSGDWAQIRCSNDWEAWTDGSRLVPSTSTAIADARAAVLESLQSAVDAYRQLMDAFAAGRIDEPTLREKAMSIGLVVKNGEAWILDVVNGKWHRYDGFQLESVNLMVEG